MAFDLVLRAARVGDANPVDIGLRNGLIAAIEPSIAAEAPSEDAGGRLVMPGFVETHLHLDKACILDRCRVDGTLADAIAGVAVAKRAFTEADVYARAETVLKKAIPQGTMRIRTHVEVDPRVALRSFNAIKRLRADYAWAVDIEICVFPQEGLLNDPGTEELLVQACEQGADLIGGCPYTDSDPHGQIARIFEIAKRFDIDIDFHLDFDLDPSRMTVEEVCRQADLHRWGGRVAIGHVTKLSAIPADRLVEIGRRLSSAGVGLTVLPATDLYLMGRGHDHNVPRGVTPAHWLMEQGVTCSLATNNVLNPFTPFGDASLVRMANLYANVAQLGRPVDLAACLDMVTGSAARLMNLKDYGIAVGNPADLVVLDATTPAGAVAELAQPLFGLKRGRRSFTRDAAVIHPPG